MISTLKSGCRCMKSSAAILAAVTEPSPALSEYGPDASLRTPIFIVRVASAEAVEHAMRARKDIPRADARGFICLHPLTMLLIVQMSRTKVRDFAPEQQIMMVLFAA